jgi:hypothetical protein
MIVPFLKQEALAENWTSFSYGRCAGPMVTKEFQLLVEDKRCKLKGQENTWEQR